jgi:hypothetical protein
MQRYMQQRTTVCLEQVVSCTCRQRVGAVTSELPSTYLFNRGPLTPLRCRRGPFPGTYMIRYAG